MDWNWKGVLQAANQYGMDGYRPGTPQAPQGYVPYEATLNQRGLPNNMQPDNSVIPGTTYQPDNFGNRQPQAVTQMEAEQQAQQQAQQQEAEKQARIKEIEAEIAEIEQRIAERKRGMAANEDALNTQLAAIEARKINGQDPTSIWRWKAGMDAQKAQRAEDLERVEKEKKLTEEKNLKINRNKIDNILQTTMPTQNMTRDKMDMAVKQLNDAEELAKNYGDTDALKKINERKNELGIYVPVDDEANIIESDFVKNMEMVGKKGGMSKKQFAQYVQSVLDDPKNKHIWHYSPELQRKLYTAIGKNTGAKPTNYAGY